MIGLDTSVLVQLEVQDSPKHKQARALLNREVLEAREALAVAPQVMMEFLHIVTDSRRFPRPLSMAAALARVRCWWSAKEVTPIFPTDESNELFLRWMTEHGLGRKRIIDTHLAATFWTAGARRIMTSNPGDFSTFGGFELLCP
jgi:toxin-antitoxin system PIN domain toxin